MSEIRPVRGPSRLAAQSAQAAEKQHIADAILQQNFEAGKYNYKAAVAAADGKKPWEADQMAYLAKMRRGGLTQPFGALIVVEPPLRHSPKLHVIAYSENTAEILGLPTKDVALGKNACNFFSDATGLMLHREALSKGGSQQPLIVRLKEKPVEFYAVLCRCDEGIAIDLEPVIPVDPGLSIGGNPDILRIPGEESPKALTMTEARQAVLPAVHRLQGLPSGSIQVLCEGLVKEIRDFLKYDRVMVYKFHPDNHGEVVAESVRDDMEPYLGLHYPATDIPQAIRILLMRVGSRLICDASRPMCKLIQADEEEKAVDLAESSLRAPHGCHVQYMKTMGSMASLTVAIPVADKKDYNDPNETSKKKRLWGLVVGHNIGGRYAAYPLRKAVEHLAQSVGSLINRETVLAANLREENILDMQKKLCDMLESNIPLGIVKGHPTIMDLVKCDGAALLFADRFWRLGVAPPEDRIADIAEWILKAHSKKSALCTDSLKEAGYPKAAELGAQTCGMVAVKIGPGDFVFWFREHTAKEVSWAGRRQSKPEEDDDKMVPRNSFKAFMEIVKRRSLPWEDIELEAINGLRLLLKETLETTREVAVNRLVGGTDIHGDVVTTASEFKPEAAEQSKPMSGLSEEVEVILKCYKNAFLVTDATQEDYPVLFCSEVYAQLTGYSADEVKGKTWRRLEGEETDELEASKLLQALDNGSNYSGKHIHYKQDGSAFWDLVTVAPVRDERDRLTHHVVLHLEVAKYAEGLEKSGKGLPSGLVPSGSEKGFPVSLIRYDGRLKERSTRKVLDIAHAIRSPSTARVDGPPTPGREGGIMEELQVEKRSPDSLDLAVEKARQASTELPKTTVRPARRRSVVDLLLGKKDEAVKPPRRAAYSVEMPSASKVEELGEDGKKRRAAKGIDFGTTLERVEFSFIVTDPRLDENPLIFMSDEYIRLTGYSREEYIGGDLLYLDGEDSSAEDMRRIRLAVQATKELSMQFQAYKKDGSAFWALFHLSMVKNTEGTVLYIVNVVKDLGRSAVSEEALKKVITKAEKEASAVAQALRDLPNAAQEEKQWTVHSRAVEPKPHRGGDLSWEAIKRVRAEEGRLGLKHFKPIKPLGNGDSGSVMLVELRGTKRLFAVKVMEKESMIERNKVHRVAAEREILQQLDHPFLPTLYASFQTAKHVCFVTDFCAGGELYDLLEIQPGHHFEEGVAQHYAAEILLALEYLHCQGVVYRDLKPENLLLTTGGHIVLTDFDLSIISSTFPKVLRDTGKAKKGFLGLKRGAGGGRPSREPHPTFVAEPLTRSNSFVGTEEYIAPEIVTGAGHSSAIDWWSYGVLLFEMLFGYTPFCGASMRKTFSNILNKEVDFPADIPVSDAARDLICALLAKDPEARLGSRSGAAEIKAHAFFAGINWALVRKGAAPAPKVPVMLDATEASAENVVDEASLDTWRLNEMGQSGASTRTSGSYAQDSIDAPPSGYGAGPAWNEAILQS